MKKRESQIGNRTSGTGILTILAMFSGCCGLAYEVLYVRALTAILGDMFYVHAALLSTFLVGIGVGAKIAHKAFRWLWVFELLTGLYAIFLPAASKWLAQQPIMVLLTGSGALTILTTIGFISAPSLLIGFSIPLFSAYIKARSPDQLAFQRVYRIYNLGAVLSILTVEFVLIRYFGIRLSLAIIGAINLFNGAILLLTRAAPDQKPAEQPRTFSKRNIAALAMASFGSAVFQMFFLKLSYLVFHPHRENFAIGLSVVMLGIFIGAWLVSKVQIRFETFLVLAAALVGLIYVGYLPILKLFEATAIWAKSSNILILIHKFSFGCLFALGPMIAFGAMIPALMRTERDVADESGHLLFVSSLANAAGYLLYVLVAHPLLTNSVLLALIVVLMLSASLLSVGLRWSKVQTAFAVVGIVLTTFMMFRWDERNFYLAHWVNTLKPEDEVTMFKSGAESATLVNSGKNVWISYNGFPSIYIKTDNVANFAEVMVGVIPALNAPRLDKALVIGFGTGITAGATSLLFKATDVVEINEAFYKMMPHLRHVNFDIEQNPSASLHLSDGRAFLVGKNQVYDAITSTVSDPTYFSASKIYTVDFYKLVRKALKDDGIFCMWIAVGSMSKEGIPTILSALHHSFRYCDLWLLRGNYYLLTCSNQPTHPRRFSELPVRPSLVRQLRNGLFQDEFDEFFEDIRLSENIFDHFTPEVARENTDNHPVLEFMVFRHYKLKKMGSDPFMGNQALFNIDPVRLHELKDAARLARRACVFYQLGEKGGDYLGNFNPILMRDPKVASEFFLESGKFNAAWDRFDEAVKILTTAINIRPNFAQAHNVLGTVLKSQGKLDEAISHFYKALQAKPDFIEAYYNLGNALTSQGKLDEAAQIFQDALAYNELSDLEMDIADIHVSLAAVLKQLNRPDQADEHFNKAIEKYRDELRKDPTAFEVWVRLGNTLITAGNFKKASECFSNAISIDSTILDNHIKLAQSLESQRRYDDAIAALKKAAAYMSNVGDKGAVEKLQEYLERLESKKSNQNAAF